MESLAEWMRSYNASAAEGEDIRFYGFDMEQHAYSYRYLLEELKKRISTHPGSKNMGR